MFCLLILKPIVLFFCFVFVLFVCLLVLLDLDVAVVTWISYQNKRKGPYSITTFFSENWKKINACPICFGARDESYGAFNITESGIIYTFELVHLNGSVSCNRKFPPSYWGCVHPYFGEERLLSTITFKNRSLLFLADYKKTGCDYHYKIKGVRVNETNLRFNILPSPISVFVGEEFQIWFTQDLMNCSEHNNGGQTCADVYALYEWIKG